MISPSIPSGHVGRTHLHVPSSKLQSSFSCNPVILALVQSPCSPSWPFPASSGDTPRTGLEKARARGRICLENGCV